MIPSVIVPITCKEIVAAIKTISKNNGEIISKFEEKFSEYVGSRYSIATHSGLSALYVLLQAHELKKSDEIIVPAYTCESVPRLLIDRGYKIKFVDIDRETYNLSIEDLQSKISRNTKAILAIHMFGNPCKMKDIMEIADDYNAVVIEDAAQSIGAEYHGKKIGTIGDSGFFSLGEGKPITTMNGGVIVTDDYKISEKCRKITGNFSEAQLSRRFKVLARLMAYYYLKNPSFYDLAYKIISDRRIKRRDNLKNSMNLDNLKFKYTDMQASIGIIQLLKLDDFNRARIRNAEFLIKHLKNLDGINLPKISKHSKPIFLRLPIWMEDITMELREDLIIMLQESGIDAPVTYPTSLPQFFLYSNGYPITEGLAKKTITLPTHPLVKKTDLTKMLLTIEQFFNQIT